MRIPRVTSRPVLSALLLPVALAALAACGQQAAPAGTASGTTTDASGATTAPATGTTAPTTATGQTGTGTGTTGTSSTTSTSYPALPALACTAAHVELSLTEAASDAGDTAEGHLVLTATNTGPKACAVRGTPEVTLVSATAVAGVSSWGVTPVEGAVKAVKLAPGASATADLTFTLTTGTDGTTGTGTTSTTGTGTDVVSPARLEVVLPMTEKVKRVSWTGPDVVVPVEGNVAVLTVGPFTAGS